MVELNHQIVLARDRWKAARFLTDLLGLSPPEEADGSTPGFFARVRFTNASCFLYAEVGHDIVPQHYAFLVSDDGIDAVLERIEAIGAEYWADPGRSRPKEWNTLNGGRGLYLLDPSGHFLEVLTRSE